MNLSGTRLWNKSLIELTKTILGFFHLYGSSNASDCKVSLKPFLYRRCPMARRRFAIRSA